MSSTFNPNGWTNIKDSLPAFDELVWCYFQRNVSTISGVKSVPIVFLGGRALVDEDSNWSWCRNYGGMSTNGRHIEADELGSDNGYPVTHWKTVTEIPYYEDDGTEYGTKTCLNCKYWGANKKIECNKEVSNCEGIDNVPYVTKSDEPIVYLDITADDDSNLRGNLMVSSDFSCVLFTAIKP